MRRSLVIALFASLPCGAWAADGVEPALGSPRQAAAVAAAVPPGRTAEAPFRARRDPLPELTLRQELSHRGRRSACEHSTELCYDLAEGRVVYRPARAYMPSIEGMRAESVSVRQDRIVLKYSFR